MLTCRSRLCVVPLVLLLLRQQRVISWRSGGNAKIKNLILFAFGESFSGVLLSENGMRCKRIEQNKMFVHRVGRLWKFKKEELDNWEGQTKKERSI